MLPAKHNDKQIQFKLSYFKKLFTSGQGVLLYNVHFTERKCVQIIILLCVETHVGIVIPLWQAPCLGTNFRQAGVEVLAANATAWREWCIEGTKSCS
jgi:hypothetical protein